MECCVCNDPDWPWPDPQPAVFIHETEGKAYCVFHAPGDKKRINVGSDECYSAKGFNDIVFARVKFYISSGLECTLRRTIFPWYISFRQFRNDDALHRIDFWESEFIGDVDFSLAEFGDYSDFSSVTFFGYANFTGAKFLNSADFDSAKFFGPADFLATQFNASVDFSEAEFVSNTNFHNSTFGDIAAFSRAICRKKMIFFNANFHSTVIFFKTAFFNEVDFRNATIFEKFYIHLERQTASDIEQIIFTRGELHMFIFRNCRWPLRLGLEKFGDKGEVKLLECEELYRAMKQKAAAEHDQQQVSNWHFREKLMQLQSLLHPAGVNTLIAAFGDNALCKSTRRRAWWELFTSLAWRRCIMLFWFWSLSGFGERPRRAGWWLGGLILLPVIFLAPLKLLETGWNSTPDWQKVAEIIAEWVRCMPLVKLEANAPTQAPFIFAVRSGLSYLFQVAIGLQGALFAMAVRNRFRR